MLDVSHTNEEATLNITSVKVKSNFRRASLEEWNRLEASKRIGLFI